MELKVKIPSWREALAFVARYWTDILVTVLFVYIAFVHFGIEMPGASSFNADPMVDEMFDDDFAASMVGEADYGVDAEIAFDETDGFGGVSEAGIVSFRGPARKMNVEAEARQYIQRFAGVAQAEQAKFGIPASISLAQGLIESRCGKSFLATNANAHFGIKCMSRSCKRAGKYSHHCINRKDDRHDDRFIRYKTPWESWRAHSILLSKPRYASLKRYGRDYRKWAFGLKSAGYATHRGYAEVLIGIIEKYDLHRFDK